MNSEYSHLLEMNKDSFLFFYMFILRLWIKKAAYRSLMYIELCRNSKRQLNSYGLLIIKFMVRYS
jgi:hypothetical protein